MIWWYTVIGMRFNMNDQQNITPHIHKFKPYMTSFIEWTMVILPNTFTILSESSSKTNGKFLNHASCQKNLPSAPQFSCFTCIKRHNLLHNFKEKCF